MTGVHISALYYYPIKSCGGTRTESAEVVASGFRYDRTLMVIDAKTGIFLTQRQSPRMALITPSICDGWLHATAPGMPALEAEIQRDGPVVETTIWKERVESVDQGGVVAAWFSDALGRACRLVRMAPAFVRQVNPSDATSRDDRIAFVDGFPFLIIAEESLAELNQRLPEPFSMDRFRPSIVLSDCPTPHFEDTLGYFKLGDLTMSAVKPCVRCKITTVNQATAAVGKEPLRTLAMYRRSAGGGVTFGMYVIHRTTGRLSVGDCLATAD